MGLNTIIYAILIFCFLIFVHELGHFLCAKAVGVRVNEFSLGMGPLLFQRKKGDTEYSLRALPIGGYVKMEGEDEDSNDPNAFNNKPFWAKALVLVAGSFMNLLTTVIIIALMAGIIGMQTNIIDDVSEGSPADQAGIMSGDTIIGINNQEVKEWGDILSLISESTGETLALTVDRNGEKINLTSGVLENESGRRMIGVTSLIKKSPGMAIKTGFTTTGDIAKQMVDYLGQLFTGKGSMNDLVGPVGIVSIINDQAKLGIIYIVNFTALISLNLAIVNMLPFPALDGGRLVFLVVRLITGKAVSDELEAKIHFAGMLVLFALMFYIVVHDVDRFILH
ncbi:RIP metalloprotease RseP [Sinanaerobacter sp. ZZT-01]|uniref:RIP metalloprotease RseP n=1 Tax=Sinanaerobacter sp. ZZT-01 TaxID=3111540 RepID=UPI002D766BF7|nr:RIP metalloprotease RseP [Sinanaerobacter sp. ZZT-01]WRR93243.1 RIP metalloprotease RseP [Sinanaerobacter sp. ZZT-01]